MFSPPISGAGCSRVARSRWARALFSSCYANHVNTRYHHTDMAGPTNADRKAPVATSENLASHMTSPPASFLLSARPRKSILKHKESENATVPISFGSHKPDPPLERPLDRRVSFAEKVQLHKIDVGPYLSETRLNSGSDDLELDGGSDAVPTFLTLEADADKTLTMLRAQSDAALASGLEGAAAGHSFRDLPDIPAHYFLESLELPQEPPQDTNASGEESEHSMELTGPLLVSAPSLGAGVGASSQGAFDPQMIHATEERASAESPHITAKKTEAQEASVINDDEIGPQASLPRATEVPRHLEPASGEAPYDGQNIDSPDASTSLHDNKAVIVQDVHHAPSLTSSEDFVDGEEDMEFTLQIEHFRYEEMTMELTLPQASDLASLSTRSAGFESSLRVFESTMNMIDANMFSHPLGDGTEEVTMDFTTPMPALAPDAKLMDTDELTMELTKPLNQDLPTSSDITHNQSPTQGDLKNIGEDSAMVLTQPVIVDSFKFADSHEVLSKPESPQSDTSQQNTQGYVSPIYVESQESVDANSVAPAESFDSAHKKGAEDLSTINEEDSEHDSSSKTRAELFPVELVQTPTNIEHPEGIASGLPRELRNRGHDRSSRESSSSSLSDNNHYEGSSPEEIGSSKHSLKPAMNPSPPKKPKAAKEPGRFSGSRTDEMLNSQSEDSWAVPEISLMEFLEKIGIKFYDDLEIATDLTAMYQPALSGTKQHLKEAYFRANIQLPLFEIYVLTCKELASQINEGKKNFDKLKEECQQSNPYLFKQYLSSLPHKQFAMRSNYHMIKEYARQKARGLWYQWKKKIIRNVLYVYQNSFKELQNQKISLEADANEIYQRLDSVNDKLRVLKSDFKRFKEIQTSSKGLGIEHVQNMKTRMVDLNKNLLKHKISISEKEKSIILLRSKIEDEARVLKQLEATLSETNEELSKMKHFNSKEIDDLRVISQILQACSGLKFISHQNHLYQFKLDPRIIIQVDSEKLYSQLGLLCQILDIEQTSLFNKSLINVFEDLVNNQNTIAATNAFEKFSKIRALWEKLRLIDQEIFRINLLHPVNFVKDEPSLICFRFEYLSSDAKTKIEFIVSIPKQDLMQYPEGNTVRTRTLKVAGDHEKLIKNALLEVGENLAIFTHL